MSHYDINVSKNGQHYFATHERSITDEDKARTVYAHFKQVFPEADGFHITVTHRWTAGQAVNFDAQKV